MHICVSGELRTHCADNARNILRNMKRDRCKEDAKRQNVEEHKRLSSQRRWRRRRWCQRGMFCDRHCAKQRWSPHAVCINGAVHSAGRFLRQSNPIYIHTRARAAYMRASARALTGQKNSTTTDKMKKINQTGQRLLFNIPVFSNQNDVFFLLSFSSVPFASFVRFAFSFLRARSRSLHASPISAFRAFLPRCVCVCVRVSFGVCNSFCTCQTVDVCGIRALMHRMLIWNRWTSPFRCIGQSILLSSSLLAPKWIPSSFFLCLLVSINTYFRRQTTIIIWKNVYRVEIRNFFFLSLSFSVRSLFWSNRK